MKKFLTAVLSALLIAVLAICVTGCGKTSAIKTAFKNAGYEVTSVSAEDSDELKGLLKTDEQKQEISKYKVYTCANMERKAIIIKFPSEEVMKGVLGETTFDKKTEDGYINGDCYFFSGCTDALYVFKNA